MSERIGKESFGYQRRWNKFILGYGEPLPAGCRKPTLVAYCFAMADKGTAGLGCYASDSTIAKEIGIYHREDVGKYRRLATELGWFRVAKRVGRAQYLDIRIPNAPLAGAIGHKVNAPSTGAIECPPREYGECPPHRGTTKGYPYGIP